MNNENNEKTYNLEKVTIVNNYKTVTIKHGVNNNLLKKGLGHYSSLLKYKDSDIYKIHPKLIALPSDIIPTCWKTTLFLKSPQKEETTREIAVKNGVYHTDFLSFL